MGARGGYRIVGKRGKIVDAFLGEDLSIPKVPILSIWAQHGPNAHQSARNVKHTDTSNRHGAVTAQYSRRTVTVTARHSHSTATAQSQSRSRHSHHTVTVTVTTNVEPHNVEHTAHSHSTQHSTPHTAHSTVTAQSQHSHSHSHHRSAQHRAA